MCKDNYIHGNETYCYKMVRSTTVNKNQPEDMNKFKLTHKRIKNLSEKSTDQIIIIISHCELNIKHFFDVYYY